MYLHRRNINFETEFWEKLKPIKVNFRVVYKMRKCWEIFDYEVCKSKMLPDDAKMANYSHYLFFYSYPPSIITSLKLYLLSYRILILAFYI